MKKKKRFTPDQIAAILKEFDNGKSLEDRSNRTDNNLTRKIQRHKIK